MVINYTTIRSVDGLSQSDLRDTSISGTYTAPVVTVESGNNESLLVVAGITSAGTGVLATWLIDIAKNFTGGLFPLPVLVGDLVTNTTTSATSTVSGFNASYWLNITNPIFGVTGHSYEIRRAFSPNVLLDTTKDFTLASPPLPVVEGDTVVNTDTSATALVATVFGPTILILDTFIMSVGASYEIRRGTASGDPGLILLDVVPDGKGFRYVFVDEPTP